MNKGNVMRSIQLCEHWLYLVRRDARGGRWTEVARMLDQIAVEAGSAVYEIDETLPATSGAERKDEG